MDDQAAFHRASGQGNEPAGRLQDALCVLQDAFADPATSPILSTGQEAIESLRKSLGSLTQPVLLPLEKALKGLASVLAAPPPGTVDQIVEGFRLLENLLRERILAATPPPGPAAGADSLLEAMNQVPMEEVLQALKETLQTLLNVLDDMDATGLLAQVDKCVSGLQDEIVSGLDRTVFQPLTESLGSLRLLIDGLPIAEIVDGIQAILASLKDVRDKMKIALQPLLDFLSILEAHKTPPLLEDFLQDAGDFASKLETLALGPLPAACKEMLSTGMPVLGAIGKQNPFEELKPVFDSRYVSLQTAVQKITNLLGELEARGKTTLDPLTRAMETVKKTVTPDPEAWMSPLRRGLSSLRDDLSLESLELRPRGLQEQFGNLTASLQTLDPDSWSSTLHPLYLEIQVLFARLPQEATGGTMSPTLEEKLRALNPVPVLSNMRASFLLLQDRIVSLDPSGLGDRIEALYQQLPESLEKKSSDALETVSAALNGCLQALRTVLATLQDNVGQLSTDLAAALRAFKEMDFQALSDRLGTALKDLEARFKEWCLRGDQALAAIAGQVGRLQARGVV